MKILNNRKGIELSINFIVMLILGIAVFAGGLVFASKFFGHAENVRQSLDSQTEKQIEKLLADAQEHLNNHNNGIKLVTDEEKQKLEKKIEVFSKKLEKIF